MRHTLKFVVGALTVAAGTNLIAEGLLTRESAPVIRYVMDHPPLSSTYEYQLTHLVVWGVAVILIGGWLLLAGISRQKGVVDEQVVGGCTVVTDV